MSHTFTSGRLMRVVVAMATTSCCVPLAQAQVPRNSHFVVSGNDVSNGGSVFLLSGDTLSAGLPPLTPQRIEAGRNSSPSLPLPRPSCINPNPFVYNNSANGD